jgi:5,5'-dehydrodivanillate O-demethylase oxygenase subunit
MITREQNERWTRVGPGTPGGEMLRHYWWPIAFADEVKGPRPKKVRLLAEDFVLFRDGSGRLGMLEAQCAHRRAPMQYGRVEKDGIRCCYHGWVWDAQGRCIETPCEEPESTLKERVKMASYPVQEAAGFVFAYIGPQPAPLLPKYDLLVKDTGKRYVWGFTDHCNWVQSAENAVDGSHLAWLHAGPYPIYARKRMKIEYKRADYGIDYYSTVPGLPNDKRSTLVFPSANRFESGRAEQAGGLRQNMLFRVPQDDTHTLNFFISIYTEPKDRLEHHTETPPEVPERGPWIPTQRGVYPAGDEEWWGVYSMMQDRMVQEGQGLIYDRTTENLAATDRGVVLFRQLLRESIDAVEAGHDPVGVVRDPAKNELLDFGTRMHALPPRAEPVVQ